MIDKKGSRQRARRERWTIALILAYSLGISAWLLVNGVHVTFDDGYYYFTIARHLAAGSGATFDGTSITTGFHPLWLLCLVPIFRVTGQASTALLIGNLVQAVLAAVATALVFAAARLRLTRGAAVLAALVWVALTHRLWLSGVEFSLHAVLLLAVVNVYLRMRDGVTARSTRTCLVLGILLSLAVLTRLEAVLLAGVLGARIAASERQRRDTGDGFGRLLALVLPVVVTCAAYLAVTGYVSGHVLPVSALVKRSWSLQLLAEDPRYVAHGWLVAKLYHAMLPLRGFVGDWYYRPIVLGVFAAGVVWVGRPRRGRAGAWFERVLVPWSPLFLYGCLGYLGYVLAYHRGLSFSAWYYVVQPLVAAVLCASLTDGLRRALYPESSRTRLGATIVRGLLIVGAIALTVHGLWTWRQRERDDPRRMLYDNAAQWIRDNLPPNAVVGAWNAGTIGYWSERRVVNLDGVVNDLAYFETYRHDLCRYWDTRGITHLVDVFEDDRALSTVPTYPSYERCAGRLELLWRDDQYDAPWELRAYRLRPGR